MRGGVKYTRFIISLAHFNILFENKSNPKMLKNQSAVLSQQSPVLSRQSSVA